MLSVFPGSEENKNPDDLTLSPLSSHSMGSPDLELPDNRHNIIFNSFLIRNFPADISALRE